MLTSGRPKQRSPPSSPSGPGERRGLPAVARDRRCGQDPRRPDGRQGARAGQRGRPRAVAAGHEGEVPAASRRGRKGLRGAGRAPGRRRAETPSRWTSSWPCSRTPGRGVRAVEVHKHRRHYTIDGCMVEMTEVIAADQRCARSPSSRRTPLGRRRGRRARPHEPGQHQLPALAQGRRRHGRLIVPGAVFAVIDVGTNSVKFHIGERRDDGSWRTIVDRAEVTRLGEGIAETGDIAPAAMERTVGGDRRHGRRGAAPRRLGRGRGRHHGHAQRRQQRRLHRPRARALRRSPSRCIAGRGGGPARLPRGRRPASASPTGGWWSSTPAAAARSSPSAAATPWTSSSA